MSLFGRKFNPKEDTLPQDAFRYRHLDRVVKSGKAVAREPDLQLGSTVMFLPYPDFEDQDYRRKGAVLPDRLSQDARDYSRWLFYAEGVRKFGKNGVTLLFDNPDDAGFIPHEDHPVYMVREAAYRALKANALVETPFGTSDSDRWDLLLNGDRKNKVYACLPMPSLLFLAYAGVFSSGKEDFFAQNGVAFGMGAGDLPVVWVMSGPTGQTLYNALDETVQTASGLDYKHPTVTGQKYVHFYNLETANCTAMRNAQSAAAVTAAQSGGVGRRPPPVPTQGQGQPTAVGYGVYVTDTFDGRPGPALLPRAQAVKTACQNLLPWEEVLRGHSPAECAEVVATRCGLPLSLLYHAWKSRPEFYTDEIKDGVRRPRSVEVRSTPQAGATDELGGGPPDGDTLQLDGDDRPTPAGAVPWDGGDDATIDPVAYQQAAARLREVAARQGNQQAAQLRSQAAQPRPGQQPRR